MRGARPNSSNVRPTIEGLGDEGEHLSFSEAKVLDTRGECVSRSLRAGRQRCTDGSNEGTVPSACFNHVVPLQLTIGARDRIRGQTEFGGEGTHRWQSGVVSERAGTHGCNDLAAQLFKRWCARSGINRKKSSGHGGLRSGL